MVSLERSNSGKPTHMVTVFEAQEMVLSSHAVTIKPLYQSGNEAMGTCKYTEYQFKHPNTMINKNKKGQVCNYLKTVKD